MLDYYLKASASDPITLEIFDAAGKLVQRFSSADKPEPVDEKKLVVPTYWLRPPQMLSAEAGMHRFIWDLRYPPPQAPEHEYPISAIYRDTPRYPLGPAVVPGQYSVKLTAGGSSYTQPLTIKMDPRVKASEEELLQQLELESKIVDAMHEDYQAVQQIRALRRQLGDLKTRAGQVATSAALDRLDKNAAELEGTKAEFGARLLSTPEGRSLVRLNAALNILLGSVDGADAAPTTQAINTFVEVQKILNEQLTRWSVIKNKDVPALNAQLQSAHLPSINMQ
jgi:hypothetical protein